MKHSRHIVSILAGVVLIGAAPASHAIIYEYEYDGSSLPNASTPAWYHTFAEGSSTVSDGALNISVPELGKAEAWEISSVWNPTEVGSAIEIRMKVNETLSGADYAGNFTIATGTAVWIVGFKETGIEDILSSNPFISLNTANDFHTYRFEITGTNGDVSIFIDNSPVAAGVWSNHAATSGRYLVMGYSITSVVGGDISIDSVRWTNAAVPEPSTALLLIGGIFAATFHRHRRRA